MRKILPETDLRILEGLAAGYSNKELAVMYNVSPAYVSKLKNGKKVPYVHVHNPTLIKDEFFEVYNTDLTEVLAYMDTKDIIVSRTEIIEYIEVQMKKAIIRAKMYQDILKKFKGE